MGVSSDSILEYKEIKNTLSRLTSRQLYTLIHEMYINNIDIAVSENMEYLTNQIQFLGRDTLLLDTYIDRCMKIVIGDEYINWLNKSLRTAIWFDVYISTRRANICIDRFYLYADFRNDFLRSFDICHFLEENNFNLNYFDIRSNSFLIPDHDSTPFSLKVNPDYEFKNYSSYTTLDLGVSSKQHEPTIIDHSSSGPLRSIHNSELPSRPLRHKKIINNLKHQTRLKIKFITLARREYSVEMASVQDLKWIDDKDKQQIDWAINHLESKCLLWKPYLFTPNGYKDKYDQICASIDAFELQKHKLKHNDKIINLSQKDFIEKMRNAWYQIKSKGKASKKLPEKLSLDMTYQKKLQKLCDNYGVDSSTYLKGLIDDELKKL